MRSGGRGGGAAGRPLVLLSRVGDPQTGRPEAAMGGHSDGAIALPGALVGAPRPKSLEEQVAEQLPDADAAAGVAICKRLATEPRSPRLDRH